MTRDEPYVGVVRTFAAARAALDELEKLCIERGGIVTVEHHWPVMDDTNTLDNFRHVGRGPDIYLDIHVKLPLVPRATSESKA